MFHSLNYIKSFALFSLLFFVSCSSGDGEDSINEVVNPSNLSITANVLGKDNENPNGMEVERSISLFLHQMPLHIRF